jgi:hypothetical protein
MWKNKREFLGNTIWSREVLWKKALRENVELLSYLGVTFGEGQGEIQDILRMGAES